mmetsp:Transcript_3101/g.9829  ORF Transcript_3101/g.9829 Transcript_3101/m.9829 type:complete len:106 (+) Transcript_3101:168-485(+)
MVRSAITSTESHTIARCHQKRCDGVTPAADAAAGPTAAAAGAGGESGEEEATAGSVSHVRLGLLRHLLPRLPSALDSGLWTAACSRRQWAHSSCPAASAHSSALR